MSTYLHFPFPSLYAILAVPTSGTVIIFAQRGHADVSYKHPDVRGIFTLF